jgi:hypothetical protein
MFYKIKNIKPHVFFLSLYLIILPIDGTLGIGASNTSLINFIFIPLVGFALFDIIFGRKLKYNIKLLSIPFLYGIYFILSSFWNPDIDFNNWYLLMLVTGFITFVFVSLFDYNEDEMNLLKYSLVVSAILVSVIVLLNYDFASNSRFYLDLGKPMDPNYFSASLILPIIIILDLLITKRKIYFFIPLALLVFSLLVTGSRAGLLSLVISVFVYFIFFPTKFLMKIILLSTGLITAIVMFIILSKYLGEFVIERFSLASIFLSGGSGRTLIWTSLFKAFYQSDSIFNLIFGYGFGSARDMVQILTGEDLATHSMLFQSIYEGGIIGFILLVLLFVISYNYIIKKKNLVNFSVFAGLCISALTLDMYSTRYFWIIISFIVIDQTLSKTSMAMFSNENTKELIYDK